MTALSRVAGRLAHLRPAEHPEVGVERDLAMAADDGVVLLADRWAPAGVDPTTVPVVLLRSPYGRRTLDLVGRLLAERGYQVVIQSVRGTFGSGGSWEPFRNERADGHAALRWIARQPWWSGVVGTFGPSYLGLTQWAVADDPPQALRAMALSITSSAFRHAVVYPGGTFALETGATWLNLLEHQEGGMRSALAAQLHARRRLAAAYTTLPLNAAESAGLGRRIDYYQDWLAHEHPGDPWWDPVDFAGDGARLPPAALLGGWYDIFLPHQLEDYARLRAAGRDVRLTIGPWTHSSLRVSAAALADGLDGFDTRLRGRAPAAPRTGAGSAGAGAAGAGAAGAVGSARAGSERRRPAVRVRLVGTRSWLELDAWPPPAGLVRWHLHAGGALRRVAPGPSQPSRYRWNPADPTPGHGGPSLDPTKAGPRDQRRRERRTDVVTFTTDPLPAGLTLVGPVSAEIWLRSSNWHTDLFVRLCHVSPRGRSTNLTDGILRLEPTADGGVGHLGTATDGEVAAAGDGTVRVRIRMWPTGVRLGGGHRLRLQVSGGAHPLFARNLGGGERLGVATTIVPADHQIHHDPEHPSSVVLPHAEL
ncbi:MAG: CocE/NonD family hydrolase [Acidimicrobiales bacterium]